MLHNYVTNEFKNSAVAKDQSDVRTTWNEAKWMVYVTVPLMVAVFAGMVKQLGG